MKTKIALAVALALVAGSAVAADDGFYVGAGMGYSNWNVNDNKIDNSIDNAFLNAESDAVVSKSSTTQTATPWELYVGYRFNKYFATELGWIDNGGSNYKGNVVDSNFPTVTIGQVKGTRSASGWPLSVLGIYPIDDAWEVFARAGVYFGSTDTKARATDGFTSVKLGSSNGKSTTNFIGGLGMNYNFMDAWQVRVEWFAIPSFGDTKYGSGNLNAFMGSINYKF
jgi:OmpA-OmpF porin, OOP family